VLPRHSQEERLSDSFDFSELFSDFRDEGRDQLARLDDALLALDAGGPLTDAARAELLRGLHTLKGNAGMLGLRPLQDYVHALETVLRQSSPALAGIVAPLQRSAAALRRAVEQAGTPGQDAALAALDAVPLPAAAPPPIAGVTLVAASPVTDAVGSSAETDAPATESPELSAESPTAPEAPGPAGTAETEGVGDADPLAMPSPVPSQAGDETGAEVRDEVLRVPFARAEALLNEVGTLAAALAAMERWAADHRDALQACGLRRPLAEHLEGVGAAVQAVRGSVRRIRMVPVSRVFGRFPALAAGLAREQGKRVRVLLRGEETELDKATADALLDPLLHLVRNAVDHGVELPEVREAAGKDPVATLWLCAASEGDQVRIEVEDDGRGLDVGAVVARARALGWVGADEEPPEEETAELLFRPGFSTRSEVTEVSGRGIGLDVVRSTVQRLRGNVHAEAGAEGGARFVLRLPLTVALVPVLFLESGGERLAIPAGDVEEAARVGPVERVGAAEVV
jgi:two-component system chemotaxis sensor kinase CheA